eukprot:TRINITY_DN5765_c1_g1_i2.p1 TRINITY_DN5765_c1_g1~~TRINITY_DN5765_c1_g1_i2.p1  ORF type:complete len:2489 (-),score=326.72 TRINITY_DN5765_c1_g1_i2:30-7460(-)
MDVIPVKSTWNTAQSNENSDSENGNLAEYPNHTLRLVNHTVEDERAPTHRWKATSVPTSAGKSRVKWSRECGLGKVAIPRRAVLTTEEMQYEERKKALAGTARYNQLLQQMIEIEGRLEAGRPLTRRGLTSRNEWEKRMRDESQHLKLMQELRNRLVAVKPLADQHPEFNSNLEKVLQALRSQPRRTDLGRFLADPTFITTQSGEQDSDNESAAAEQGHTELRNITRAPIGGASCWFTVDDADGSDEETLEMPLGLGLPEVDLPETPSSSDRLRGWFHKFSQLHVRRWFDLFRNGRFVTIADEFGGLAGEEILSLTKEQLVRILGVDGAALFEALVQYRRAPATDSDAARRMAVSLMGATTPALLTTFFESFHAGRFRALLDRLRFLSGRMLLQKSEEELTAIVPGIRGAVLFNALQPLRDAVDADAQPEPVAQNTVQSPVCETTPAAPSIPWWVEAAHKAELEEYAEESRRLQMIEQIESHRRGSISGPLPDFVSEATPSTSEIRQQSGRQKALQKLKHAFITLSDAQAVAAQAELAAKQARAAAIARAAEGDSTNKPALPAREGSQGEPPATELDTVESHTRKPHVVSYRRQRSTTTGLTGEGPATSPNPTTNSTSPTGSDRKPRGIPKAKALMLGMFGSARSTTSSEDSEVDVESASAASALAPSLSVVFGMKKRTSRSSDEPIQPRIPGPRGSVSGPTSNSSGSVPQVTQNPVPVPVAPVLHTSEYHIHMARSAVRILSTSKVLSARKGTDVSLQPQAPKEESKPNPPSAAALLRVRFSQSEPVGQSEPNPTSYGAVRVLPSESVHRVSVSAQPQRHQSLGTLGDILSVSSGLSASLAKSDHVSPRSNSESDPELLDPDPVDDVSSTKESTRRRRRHRPQGELKQKQSVKFKDSVNSPGEKPKPNTAITLRRGMSEVFARSRFRRLQQRNDPQENTVTQANSPKQSPPEVPTRRQHTSGDTTRIPPPIIESRSAESRATALTLAKLETIRQMRDHTEERLQVLHSIRQMAESQSGRNVPAATVQNWARMAVRADVLQGVGLEDFSEIETILQRIDDEIDALLLADKLATLSEMKSVISALETEEVVSDDLGALRSMAAEGGILLNTTLFRDQGPHPWSEVLNIIESEFEGLSRLSDIKVLKRMLSAINDASSQGNVPEESAEFLADLSSTASRTSLFQLSDFQDLLLGKPPYQIPREWKVLVGIIEEEIRHLTRMNQLRAINELRVLMQTERVEAGNISRVLVICKRVGILQEKGLDRFLERIPADWREIQGMVEELAFVLQRQNRGKVLGEMLRMAEAHRDSVPTVGAISRILRLGESGGISVSLLAELVVASAPLPSSWKPILTALRDEMESLGREERLRALQGMMKLVNRASDPPDDDLAHKLVRLSEGGRIIPSTNLEEMAAGTGIPRTLQNIRLQLEREINFLNRAEKIRLLRQLRDWVDIRLAQTPEPAQLHALQMRANALKVLQDRRLPDLVTNVGLSWHPILNLILQDMRVLERENQLKRLQDIRAYVLRADERHELPSPGHLAVVARLAKEGKVLRHKGLEAHIASPPATWKPIRWIIEDEFASLQHARKLSVLNDMSARVLAEREKLPTIGKVSDLQSAAAQIGVLQDVNLRDLVVGSLPPSWDPVLAVIEAEREKYERLGKVNGLRHILEIIVEDGRDSPDPYSVKAVCEIAEEHGLLKPRSLAEYIAATHSWTPLKRLVTTELRHLQRVNRVHCLKKMLEIIVLEDDQGRLPEESTLQLLRSVNTEDTPLLVERYFDTYMRDAPSNWKLLRQRVEREIADARRGDKIYALRGIITLLREKPRATNAVEQILGLAREFQVLKDCTMTEEEAQVETAATAELQTLEIEVLRDMQGFISAESAPPTALAVMQLLQYMNDGMVLLEKESFVAEYAKTHASWTDLFHEVQMDIEAKYNGARPQTPDLDPVAFDVHSRWDDTVDTSALGNAIEYGAPVFDEATITANLNQISGQLFFDSPEVWQHEQSERKPADKPKPIASSTKAKQRQPDRVPNASPKRPSVASRDPAPSPAAMATSATETRDSMASYVDSGNNSDVDSEQGSNQDALVQVEFVHVVQQKELTKAPAVQNKRSSSNSQFQAPAQENPKEEGQRSVAKKASAALEPAELKYSTEVRKPSAVGRKGTISSTPMTAEHFGGMDVLEAFLPSISTPPQPAIRNVKPPTVSSAAAAAAAGAGMPDKPVIAMPATPSAAQQIMRVAEEELEGSPALEHIGTMDRFVSDLSMSFSQAAAVVPLSRPKLDSDVVTLVDQREKLIRQYERQRFEYLLSLIQQKRVRDELARVEAQVQAAIPRPSERLLEEKARLIELHRSWQIRLEYLLRMVKETAIEQYANLEKVIRLLSQKTGVPYKPLEIALPFVDTDDTCMPQKPHRRERGGPVSGRRTTQLTGLLSPLLVQSTDPEPHSITITSRAMVPRPPPKRTSAAAWERNLQKLLSPPDGLIGLA